MKPISRSKSVFNELQVDGNERFGIETVDQVLFRIGKTRSSVWFELEALNELHFQAMQIAGNADRGIPGNFDFENLNAMGYWWVNYRGIIYPAKDGQSRYLQMMQASRLAQIEEQIKSINNDYNPWVNGGTIYIYPKHLINETKK